MSKNLLKSAQKAQTTPKKKDNIIPKFLVKIYEMLENDQHSEHVSWNSDGTAMVIKNAPEFTANVLPHFFKHSNLASFIRQLNMYTFKKQKNQEFDYVYAHELFRRGKRNQLAYIMRKGVENTHSVQAESTNESELIHNEINQKEEPQQEIPALVSENKKLKRNEEAMSSRLKEMEEKIAELSHKNETLLSQSKQQTADEVHLKNILNAIVAVHGPGLVQNALEVARKNGVIEEQNSTVTSSLLLPGFDFVNKSDCSTKTDDYFTMIDEYPLSYTRQPTHNDQERRINNSAYTNGLELSLTRYDSGQFYFNDQITNDPLQAFTSRYPFDLKDDCYNLGADLGYSNQGKELLSDL